MKTVIEMAHEVYGANTKWTDAQLERLNQLVELARADEHERFYGQDKPDECANGCPANQICDYCQIVEPVRKMIAAEREACAALCDRFANRMMSAEECADAIRSRGLHET